MNRVVLGFCLTFAGCQFLVPPTQAQLLACTRMETAAVLAGTLDPATAKTDDAVIRGGNLPTFCMGKL